MFRTLSRLFLPNPLDWMLKKMARRGEKKILLGWNRGLGDIALGLYAIVERIRQFVPDAEITFLVRQNLADGFSLLANVQVLVAPEWKRGEKNSVQESLKKLKIDPKNFDRIIEKPNPTDWVAWQRGNLVPKLKWNREYDSLWTKFHLPEGFTYLAVQVTAETNYGLWRNWPLLKWKELFARLEMMPNVKVLLFGFGSEPLFECENIIDLRGKTTLFELLSIVKHRCKAALLPDSGILSMLYYLDVEFPLHLVSLWADPHHGILKQAVASPNQQLLHTPLIGAHRDLSSVDVGRVMNTLFPPVPLRKCSSLCLNRSISVRAGAIILAGGQGSRLGFLGPKGLFPLGQKTLFEWICTKAPKTNFPLAIMTSPLNHEETVSFFKKHLFFDREMYFFQQGMHPFLDENKKPLKRGGPDGNGSIFKAFADSGLGALFADKNIEAVTIVPVDNPLANPYHLELISHHLETKSDVTVQCVERLHPQEMMGVLVERLGRIEIIEYLDLDPALEYRYANTGIMAINPHFLAKMSKIDLPLHFVKKKVDGKFVLKGERFIFDALPLASKVEALCFPRETCYAPLKDTESLNSELLRRFFLDC